MSYSFVFFNVEEELREDSETIREETPFRILRVANDIECIFMLYAIHISSSVKSLHVCFCLTVPCLIYIIDALTLNSQPTAQAHLIHVIFL